MTTVGLAGRLEDYIRRLDWALRDLPSEDRRGFAALIFYLFSLAFALMAILKIITPAHVGAWKNGGALEFGAHYGGPPPGGTELLGYWVIPLTVLMTLACYILGTLLLRGGARQMLRRARARTTGLQET
jgi:hypothetical protein